MATSLMRPQAAHYLFPFFETARSVAEAAALLGEPLGRTHYWVQTLHADHLLQIESVTARKGRAIKRYRTVATEFVVPAKLLPDDLFVRQMRAANEQMTQSLIAAAPEWVVGGGVRIHFDERGGHFDRFPGPGIRSARSIPSHQSISGMYLTEPDMRELQHDLEALRDKWRDRDRKDPSLPGCLVSISMAPTKS